MPFPTTLPRLTRQSVLRLFLELLAAEPAQAFSQTDLARLGLPGYRNARPLLTFLGILTPSNRLENKFLEARRQPEDLRRWLHERLVDACCKMDPDADRQQLSRIGRDDIPEGELRTILLAAVPMISQEQREQTRSNQISCLRGMHHVILHCDDRTWLEREAGDVAGDEGPKAREQAETVEGSGEAEPAPGDSASGLSASGFLREPALRASGQTPRFQAGRQDVAYHLGDFEIDYQGERILKAHVYLDAPATSDRVKTLALCLLRQAQELRERELVGAPQARTVPS